MFSEGKVVFVFQRNHSVRGGLSVSAIRRSRCGSFLIGRALRFILAVHELDGVHHEFHSGSKRSGVISPLPLFRRGFHEDTVAFSEIPLNMSAFVSDCDTVKEAHLFFCACCALVHGNAESADRSSPVVSFTSGSVVSLPARYAFAKFKFAKLVHLRFHPCSVFYRVPSIFHQLFVIHSSHFTVHYFFVLVFDCDNQDSSNLSSGLRMI